MDFSWTTDGNWLRVHDSSGHLRGEWEVHEAIGRTLAVLFNGAPGPSRLLAQVPVGRLSVSESGKKGV